MSNSTELTSTEATTTLHSSSKVHFEEADNFGKDSAVGVTFDEATLSYQVHLGYLSFRHKYKITFTFRYPKAFDQLEYTPDESTNINLQVVQLVCDNSPSAANECSIELDYFAHKERLVKERFKLHAVGDDAMTLSFTLIARVLRSGQGTPSLRQGVKCVGVELDEQSEQSDWQGFQ